MSTESERDRAIAEVLRHEEVRAEAQREARERAARRERKRRRPGPRHAFFVVALIATGYVWLGSPSWAQMNLPPEPTPERTEASLRLALYIQAQRIEHFRNENGRLPESLEEAGPPLPGIRYTATPRGTYHLLGISGSLSLFYSSSLALSSEAFLGNAEAVVFPRGRPR